MTRNRDRVASSVEAEDCVLYAPRAYLAELYHWYERLPLYNIDSVPSFFGEMMDVIEEDMED